MEEYKKQYQLEGTLIIKVVTDVFMEEMPDPQHLERMLKVLCNSDESRIQLESCEVKRYIAIDKTR